MNSPLEIKDTTANPAPIGLVGFGLTTILLNLHNAGLFALDTMILSMGIFVGGMLQIFVGLLEWKKNNMFGSLAFSAYGAFWLSLVGLIALPQMGIGTAPTATAMGYYLLLWGIFSTFLFVCTFKLTKALRLVFGTLVILFFLLAIGDFTGNATIKTIAGIEGILCGGLAFYTAMAELYENVFQKQVLPYK